MNMGDNMNDMSEGAVRKHMQDHIDAQDAKIAALVGLVLDALTSGVLEDDAWSDDARALIVAAARETAT
jgi:hypothetical protein